MKLAMNDLQGEEGTMSEQETFADLFGESISVYTQEQALEDGFLVRDPIVELAKEAGFRQPVAFSAALYAACEAAPGDLTAWLWDVLFMGMIRWRVEIGKRDAFDGSAPDSIGPLAYKLKLGRRVRTVWLSWNSYEAFTFMFPEDY